MSTPLLLLLAGPNGAGKTTFYEQLLEPMTGLPFVNADVIAAERWPGEEVAHGREAARLAHIERERRLDSGGSFVAETVSSHESKLALIDGARARGYHVVLHIIFVTVDQAVARVASRVSYGGHDVPEHKVRELYTRLEALLAVAARRADEAHVYDNSGASTPYRKVASWRDGTCVLVADPPPWMPVPLWS